MLDSVSGEVSRNSTHPTGRLGDGAGREASAGLDVDVGGGVEFDEHPAIKASVSIRLAAAKPFEVLNNYRSPFLESCVIVTVQLASVKARG